jgi:hypothetical protein
MWSDIETSQDLLGYTVHANLLKKVIMDNRNLPVTIGLYGDWGSGKSSILKILQEKIEKEDDSKDSSIVIYFDGWNFESFEDAKLSLIQGIVDKLESDKSLSANIKDSVKKVKDSIFSMKTLMWTLRNAVAPLAFAAVTGGITTIPSILTLFGSFKGKEKDLVDKLTGEGAEKFLKEALRSHIEANQFSAVHEFRGDFEKLINDTGKERVIVLVDDLDRCLPEHIIDSLEAIKLFLNVEKTAFVIAADEDIVSGAISKQYKDMINLSNRRSTDNSNDMLGRSLGSDYLDKFIQIPYSIPKLSNQEVETYVTLLFCESMMEKKDFNVIYEDYHKFIVEHKFEGYGWDNVKDMNGVKENLPLRSIITFMSRCTSSLSNSLHRNPRQIKRFLNAFELRNQLLRQSGNTEMVNAFVLLKLMLLQTSHSNLFKELSQWSIEQKGHPIEIEELEKEAKKGSIDKEKFKDWCYDDVLNLLTLEPMFSNFDLRDIYWVSRDQLIDGMGGVAMIHRKVRVLFESMYEKSDNIIQNKCNTDVKELNNDELESFYELLDDKMLTAADKKEGYIVYFYLVQCGITNSYDHFLNTFSRVSEIAPFSISNYMQQLLRSHGNDKRLADLIKTNKKLTKLVWSKKNENNK